MKKVFLVLLIFTIFLAACGKDPLSVLQPATYTPPPTNTPAPTPIPTPMPTPTYPAVIGPDPSDRVAAFYYPWYGNLKTDFKWIHWEEGGKNPPQDITSDFYPVLGAYSSADPAVVAQHFTWLRQAGVGVIITSWWGIGSPTDKLVPLLLKMGERYEIKVAFLIECSGTRSVNNLVKDVEYIYRSYGDHPAFYRTGEGSLWSNGGKQQGLFLMWGVRYENDTGDPVEPVFWQQAMDQIHALPEGGLIIADENDSEWVTVGHFDGSYKYGVLDTDMAEPYTFANALPAGAWYIPGVNPGFTRSHNMGYEDFTFSPRRDGAAYAERWQALFDTGVEPQMVAITTFNEWHEGTQIEPAVAGADNGAGYTYRDYESLPPEGYLTLTRQWVKTFLAHEWPEAHKVTFRITTTSDWTVFGLVGGGNWMRPNLVSASPEATYAGADGQRFALNQPLERAEDGQQVEMTVEVMISISEGGGPLIFEIGRGGLGYTEVEMSVDKGAGPEVVAVMSWDGFVENVDNTYQYQLPAESLGE